MRLNGVETDSCMLPMPLERPERQVAERRFGHRSRDFPRKHLLKADLPSPVRHSHAPFCDDRKAFDGDAPPAYQTSPPSPWLRQAFAAGCRIPVADATRCPYIPRRRGTTCTPIAPSESSRTAKDSVVVVICLDLHAV